MSLGYRLLEHTLSPLQGLPPPGLQKIAKWVEYSSGLTCAWIETLFGMTEAEFEEWNPIVTELGDSCTLLSGLYYCVQVNFTTISVSSVYPIPTTLSTDTSTTSTDVTSTPGQTPVKTPTPIELGMVEGCTAFHLVVSGDTCAAIAEDAGISLTNFVTWNPDMGSDRSGLWLGYYVCIGTDSSASSSTPTPTTATSTTSTTTSTGNGVTTPTPYESGMVDNCDDFYLVVSGDTCSSIVADAGVTLDDFYTWNPTVRTDCSGLWLGYYVCVGIL
ncbi:hypothetical protein BDW59DRAFT_163841 [Aspergillus cavernicola]|uniref:LysM domain-containing protein n=1 Tax=Aspergillus cavernicola TaxID=176166 RepID=A0ABR4I3B2_9EURO